LWISKKNHIPRVLVPLERIFNNNYVSRKYVMKIQEQEVVDYNIGIIVNPKLVKISRALPNQHRDMYEILMKTMLIFLHGIMRT
jgi:hypothetical protein